MNTLITKRTIPIRADALRVWEVLTKTEFIAQWDDVPEGFKESYIREGSELLWDGTARLTVTEFESAKRLKMNLYTFSWELPPETYDIAYKYSLHTQSDLVELIIEVGDFSVLPNGSAFYEASLKFVETAGNKIKELAESVQP